jgi:hypothetical protein
LIAAEAFSFPKPIATVRSRFFKTTRNAGISPGAAAALKVNTDDVIRGDLICQSSADQRGFGWLLTRNDLPAILNELKSRLGLEPQI